MVQWISALFHRGRPPCTPKPVDSNHYLDLQLSTIIQNQGKIMSGLTDLQAAVANLTTTVNSAVTYLQGLPAQIMALQNATDPDGAVAALAAQVQSETNTLASALQAAPLQAPEPTPGP